MVANGTKCHKRKQSQQERDAKMAKRVQKTQERRGQRPLQPDAEGKEPQQRVVPAEWGCQIRDVAAGKFVALKVMYEKPRGRAVEIEQVPLLCATCKIVVQGLHHNNASEVMLLQL